MQVMEEVIGDFRHGLLALLWDGSLFFASEPLLFVPDVLAVGEDEEPAEDGPLYCVSEVLKRPAGGLPAGPLPVGKAECGEHGDGEEYQLDDAHPQGEGVGRSGRVGLCF